MLVDMSTCSLLIDPRIHGGSFIVGGASAAGLDGSTLALATNSIVAVIQYRLGAVGAIYFCLPGSLNNLSLLSLDSWRLTAKQILQ